MSKNCIFCTMRFTQYSHLQFDDGQNVNSKLGSFELLVFTWHKVNDLNLNPTQPSLSESCTGLTETWSNLVTKTIFPVKPGTSVTVECDTGYRLSGDKVITCQTDKRFSFKQEPSCALSMLLLPLLTLLQSLSYYCSRHDLFSFFFDRFLFNTRSE